MERPFEGLDDVSYHVVSALGLCNYGWDKRHISCPPFRVPRQHNCNLQAKYLQDILHEIVLSNSWMSVEKSREGSLQPTCDKQFQLYETLMRCGTEFSLNTLI